MSESAAKKLLSEELIEERREEQRRENEQDAARVLSNLIALTPEAVAEAVAEWLTELVADDSRAYGVAGPIDGRVMLLLKGGALLLIDVNHGEVTLA